MILEKLKLLKSYGSSPESTVTEADLTAKERELGIELPEDLRELYLTFDPQDPIFSQTYRLLPLSELTVVEAKTFIKGAVCIVLPFIEKLKTAEYNTNCLYAVTISVSDAVLKDSSGHAEGEWPLCVKYFPESGKIDRWMHPLNVEIMDFIANTLTYSMPQLVFVDGIPYYKEMRELIWSGFSTILTPKSQTEWFPERHIIVSQLYQRPMGFQTLMNGTIFAARDEAVLREWMKDKPLKFEWLKQNGELLFAPPKEFEPPKERTLYSIAPILKFLREFAGVTEFGLSEQELQKAEDKLGPLPLPIREYYALFPKAFYKTHNNLRPLSSIRKTKSGILNFLEENQSTCYWGFSVNSPFLYCKMESKWEVIDYLDTFLAQEFAWELMSSDELGLEFEEISRVNPKAMQSDGILASQLTEIAGLSHKLAWSFGVELFQTLDGRVVVLYNHGCHAAFLMSKDSDALEQLKGCL